MDRRAIFALTALAAVPLFAVDPADLDRDGLNDAFEQALLERFRPTFMLSASECDVMPSEFQAGKKDPVKPERNGTIYGRVFPTATGGSIEIHYYHLWARDCGFGQHPLDIEHVAVLVEAPAPVSFAGEYKAKYWFASGHQGTVCDAANGARASDIAAVTSGGTVWISRGKHASFLSQDACNRLGCGGDSCEIMSAMPPGKLINIGEAGAPMNGATWTASKKWAFQEKLTTDFTSTVIARIESAQPREVVSIYPALIPAKAFILGGNHTLTAVGTGGKHTGSALQTADKHTTNALGLSVEKTGNALKKAGRSTAEFLGFKTKKTATETTEKNRSKGEEKTK